MGKRRTGLEFKISEGGLITVSSVLELSAANFAGIRAGDVLLQFEDLRIDCLSDANYADIAKRFFYFMCRFSWLTRLFSMCVCAWLCEGQRARTNVRLKERD